MTAGAPTKYRKEFCELVIGYGEDGKSRAWIAATLGVVRQTLANWEASHPEFLDAMERAHNLAQKWWEDAGQEGMTTSGFNGSVYSRSMAARFPDDWRETTRNELTGKDGGRLEFGIVERRIVQAGEE
jgi:hypothetical protein